MLNISMLSTALLLTLTLAPAETVSPTSVLETLNSSGPEVAEMTCFLSGEKVSGMNKICFYDCAGSEAAITVKSYELCPLTIKQ